MIFSNIQFMLLCLSSFLFFSSFNMIIPELPAYLASLGGEAYKGLIISLFTLTAGLSRPFSGKLTDTIGRIPVMTFGVTVCVICSLLYPLVQTIFLFLALRFIHGLSTGFKPTATAAFIADIIPERKRGKAMGFLGFFSSLGMAFGPLFGSYIATIWELNAMFYTSSFLAFLSIAILWKMNETLQGRQPFHLKFLRIQKSDFIYKKVFPAAITICLTVLPFGVVLTFIPDLSQSIGIENKGEFFLYYTIATILVRIFTGTLSDKYGRIFVLRIGVIFLTFSSLLISLVTRPEELRFAAFIYGIGTGFCAPTLFAWTIDLSEENLRGKAFATLYIALEVGIGFGAFFSGVLNNISPNNYFLIFSFPTFFCFLAVIYLFTMVKLKDGTIHLQK